MKNLIITDGNDIKSLNLEEISDTETMEKIKTEVLTYLN